MTMKRIGDAPPQPLLPLPGASRASAAPPPACCTASTPASRPATPTHDSCDARSPNPRHRSTPRLAAGSPPTCAAFLASTAPPRSAAGPAPRRPPGRWPWDWLRASMTASRVNMHAQARSAGLQTSRRSTGNTSVKASMTNLAGSTQRLRAGGISTRSTSASLQRATTKPRNAEAPPRARTRTPHALAPRRCCRTRAGGWGHPKRHRGAPSPGPALEALLRALVGRCRRDRRNGWMGKTRATGAKG